MGATGYSSLQEKQELISVDSDYVDRGQVTLTMIDPQTDGDVIWNGRAYLVQPEYDNLCHGRVFEDP